MRTVTLALVVLSASLFAVWGLSRVGTAFGKRVPAYTVEEMQALEAQGQQLELRHQRTTLFSARLDAARQDLIRGTTTLSDAVDGVLAESKRNGPHFIDSLSRQEDGRPLRLRAALALLRQVHIVCYYGGPQEQWPSIRERLCAELAGWDGVTPELLRRIPLDAEPYTPESEIF
jgi:hypothetical protein